MFPIHVFDILATTKYQEILPVSLLLFKHKQDKTFRHSQCHRKFEIDIPPF